jgi:hypothetical protein
LALAIPVAGQGNKNVSGTGVINGIAVFSDSKTITSSQSLTFINGVLSAPTIKAVTTWNTGQDVPPPMLDVRGVWNAERGGDVYIANFEYHCVGKQQAACHGIYVSSWSDSWDAYGWDARVEAGTSALQSYGAQFTVIADNPSAAQWGVKASLHGASDGSEIRDVFMANAQDTKRVNGFHSGTLYGSDSNGLLIDDVTGTNSYAIQTKAGPVQFGNLKRPEGGVKPVCVDTATGTLTVCP